MPTRSYRWLLFTLAVCGFAADQATKYGMFNWLYQDGHFVGQKEVIPGALKFFTQYDPFAPACDCPFARWNGPVPPRVNRGALFSLGGEHGERANQFFAVVSVLAAIGISVWGARRSTGQDKWLCVALGLILAGTVGNLFDRVVFGGVRDFVYWYYLIDWPVFNVADCGLVIGALLLLVQAIFAKKKEPDPAAAAPAATPSPTAEPPPGV